MTYRVLLLQGGQIFCLTMKTVYVYVFRTASPTVYCTVKQLTNDRRAEICARLQWQGCTGTFTMIVSDEQLHFYRLCGTSMYFNVLGLHITMFSLSFSLSSDLPLRLYRVYIFSSFSLNLLLPFTFLSLIFQIVVNLHHRFNMELDLKKFIWAPCAQLYRYSLPDTP